MRVILYAFAGIANAQENLKDLEARFEAARYTFEVETQEEFMSISSDRSVSGEKSVALKEKWFASQSERVVQINKMAELLDKISPIYRRTPDTSYRASSPEEIAASELHRLSFLFSEGAISPSDFDKRRGPIFKNILASQAKKDFCDTTKVPVISDVQIDGGSTEKELADMLHEQRRYLVMLAVKEEDENFSTITRNISRVIAMLESRIAENVSSSK